MLAAAATVGLKAALHATANAVSANRNTCPPWVLPCPLSIVAVTTAWQTVTGANHVSVLLLELLALLVGGAVILLIVVMRGLLADATALRVEMDEVV